VTAQQGFDGLGPNGNASAGWGSASTSSVRPEQKTEPVEGFVSKGFDRLSPNGKARLERKASTGSAFLRSP
jgi:hypothetical protein